MEVMKELGDAAQTTEEALEKLNDVLTTPAKREPFSGTQLRRMIRTRDRAEKTDQRRKNRVLFRDVRSSQFEDQLVATFLRLEDLGDERTPKQNTWYEALRVRVGVPE